MIRDSLRRRVSALEHDRQEREKFTGAATEQALALRRPIHREGTASPRRWPADSAGDSHNLVGGHPGNSLPWWPVRTPDAVEAAAWQTLKTIADLEVPDLATGEDLRQYLDRLIERLDLAAVVEP